MAPRVLVSDKLSETAVQIFRDRGVEVDYLPDLGKDKEALLAAIEAAAIVEEAIPPPPPAASVPAGTIHVDISDSGSADDKTSATSRSAESDEEYIGFSMASAGFEED